MILNYKMGDISITLIFQYFEYINKLHISKTKKLHHPGVEPGSTAWKAIIIPLDHWCSMYVVFKENI